MTTIQAAPPIPRGTEPRPKRWTRDEYYALARQGYFDGRRVFLLDGEIIETAAQGNWHSVVLGMAEDVLAQVFPRGTYWARVQRPLELPEGSEPEPDLAIVRGRPQDFVAHPGSALLIVEVADSSLRFDRRKANAYAAAGIPEYWIVDIRGHAVERYRDPVAAHGETFGHRYAGLETLKPGESISPVAAPAASVAVADLLPKHPVVDPDA